MVLNIYRRFSRKYKFLLKGKVATARGYDARACQNRQPVLFHRHPGQAAANVKIRGIYSVLLISVRNVRNVR